MHPKRPQAALLSWALLCGGMHHPYHVHVKVDYPPHHSPVASSHHIKCYSPDPRSWPDVIRINDNV
eukprot:scaffold273582_cov23-Prasinocladus_malaysianus.AAC.1